MSVMIVSEAMKAQLTAAESSIKVCSSDGNVLSYFTPAKAKRLNLDPGITDDEMLARVAAGGGRSLTEILAELEAAA
jgi:hypothetical protein